MLRQGFDNNKRGIEFIEQFAQFFRGFIANRLRRSRPPKRLDSEVDQFAMLKYGHTQTLGIWGNY